ncbi:transcriptional regulator NanR [Chelativorans sp. M5D2P16]|uniref:transcriptional regulator NanR n=1 Tax=Chelativorans sp. M5D2P16 TaxID=3095678 RepID=UPI002ACA9C76|nr:transcriptional regulator NanR [Chelativorans sp. M5D2P16]MDZ5696520.1 transcriptional regulator NanR [Chelativorans sp. M5D2P16]
MDRWNGSNAEDSKIIRRKLSDQVLERLREMIVRGELGPGDLMPSERELMERFGVGRPAVREAMQSMHTLGLITISHGERARVSELSADMMFRQMDMVARMLLSASPDNLEHLKEARRLFELGMIRIATERAQPADIEDLKRLVEEQRSKLGDAAAFIKTDMAFHRKIASLSDNPIFAAISDAMLNWLFNYHTDLLFWSGQENVTLSEHEEIVACIEEGDPERAAAAMRSHLDRSADLYRYHD